MENTPQRNYPLPRPDDDARFTFGLQLDVAKTLERHGYPKVTGLDFVELGLALFRFIYADRETAPAPDWDCPHCRPGAVCTDCASTPYLLAGAAA